MLTTLPLILNKNNVNKVVKVVLEFFKLANIHVIYKNIRFPTDIYVYKKIFGSIVLSFMLAVRSDHVFQSLMKSF